MRRFLIAVLPLALLAIGCSKPAPYLGKWKFAEAVPKTGDAKQDATIAAEQDKFILELKDDKTWTATPPGETMNGTYTASGTSLTFMKSNPKTEDDKKSATGTVSEDGKTLSFNPPDGTGAMKFAKM